LFLQTGSFLSPTLRLFLLLATVLFCDLIFFPLLLSSSSSCDLISVGFNLVAVNLRLSHNEVADESVGVAAHRVHLRNILSSLLMQPGNDFSLKHLCVESVAEVAHVSEESKRVLFDVAHEIFA